MRSRSRVLFRCCGISTMTTRYRLSHRRFFRPSHDGFVGDLSRIHYTLGKIENVGQMLAAAQGVEWQSLGGVQGHKMFTNAQKILEDARDELTSAKDTTIRKLDALMQMPYVQDAIHIEA